MVNEDREALLQYLDNALGQLEQTDRELILDYYRGDGRNKIEYRKAMARRLGVGPNALRLRVYRIRAQLRNHLFETVNSPAFEPSSWPLSTVTPIGRT